MNELTRRYFFMNKSQADLTDVQRAMQMAIGGGELACIESIDKTVVFIKTRDKEISELLAEYPDYNLQQILELTFTTESTIEEAQTRLGSLEFTEQTEI